MVLAYLDNVQITFLNPSANRGVAHADVIGGFVCCYHSLIAFHCVTAFMNRASLPVLILMLRVLASYSGARSRA